MECLFGITGKDFVLVASDTMAVRSIVVMKSSEKKYRKLNDNTVMLYTGEPGDTVAFAEYIERNIRLYGIRNSTDLGPKEAAAFTRKELAEALRSRHPYSVNLLLAGYDTRTKEPHLYWIDYLAASAHVPYAAQGYGSYFCLSIMDKYHKPDLSLDEAKALMKKCIDELATRFIINYKQFDVQVVDAEGIREVSL